MFHVLTEDYNVPRDRIRFLYVAFQASRFRNMVPEDTVDEICTVYHVRRTITEWLNSTSDENVLIYVASHGVGYNLEENLLKGGRIDADEDEEYEISEAVYGEDVDEDRKLNSWFGVDEAIEFSSYYENFPVQYYWDDVLKRDLESVTCNQLILIFDACYSGGFIDDLSAPNRVIITSTGETNRAWHRPVEEDEVFDEFSGNLIDALHGYNASWYNLDADNRIEHGDPVNADANNNGVLTWREIYNYAKKNDCYAYCETPWFDDDGNGYPTYVNGRVYRDYRLTLTHNYGGTTSPSPGEHIYVEGTVVSVYAIVRVSGYEFDHWVPDNWPWYYSMYNIYPRENPYNVTMDADHSLFAYFVEPGSTSGGDDTCPTLFVWNGTGYVDYGVIDIHNPSGEDVVREVSIATEDLAVENGKAKIRLQEGWEGLNFSESEIDQVRLYAINEDGKQKPCPLLSAEHSSLGDILEEIKASDDVKVQILLLETIDLTFKVSEDVQGFTFIIEGCNMYKQ